ncbi:hypothetical protein [Streptomyces sp. N35]|uniref:hypothetical protein n=1 Tax=Streptomyces sp. N35 TaxID=2795730 RepID=UPI0018F2DEF5|nr:hypothetical protein [Streptomyces sp. N35]
MSSFLFDADLGATDFGRKARERVSVADTADAYAAQLISEYREAVASGRRDLMQLIREHAAAIDPLLVDELDGFDYPAAA